jgi:hypothetical protein
MYQDPEALVQWLRGGSTLVVMCAQTALGWRAHPLTDHMYLATSHLKSFLLSEGKGYSLAMPHQSIITRDCLMNKD